MTNHHQGLTGPEFLDHVANAEEALGNEINAAEYRRRAKQWEADIAELESLRPAPEPMPLPMAHLRRASSLPAHHITPSDRR